jgi:hypothetical protein
MKDVVFERLLKEHVCVVNETNTLWVDAPVPV